MLRGSFDDGIVGELVVQIGFLDRPRVVVKFPDLLDLVFVVEVVEVEVEGNGTNLRLSLFLDRFGVDVEL